jgi:hypothetical protein
MVRGRVEMLCFWFVRSTWLPHRKCTGRRIDSPSAPARTPAHHSCPYGDSEPGTNTAAFVPCSAVPRLCHRRQRAARLRYAERIVIDEHAAHAWNDERVPLELVLRGPYDPQTLLSLLEEFDVRTSLTGAGHRVGADVSQRAG